MRDTIFPVNSCQRHCISSQNSTRIHVKDTVFLPRFMSETLYFQSTHVRDTVFPVKTAREFTWETLYLQSKQHEWRGNVRDAGFPVNSWLMTHTPTHTHTQAHLARSQEWRAPAYVLSTNCDAVCYTLVTDTTKISHPTGSHIHTKEKCMRYVSDTCSACHNIDSVWCVSDTWVKHTVRVII